MDRPTNYYNGFPDAMYGYGTGSIAPPYAPVGPQQATQFGTTADSIQPPQPRNDDYHHQVPGGMHLSSGDAHGDYDFDVPVYATSANRNESAASASDGGDVDSDLAAVRIRNRRGNDVRMVISNHSNNINFAAANSTASSVASSNDFAPPTPNADSVRHGHAMGSRGGHGLGSGRDSASPTASDIKHEVVMEEFGQNAASNTVSSPSEPFRKKQKRNKPTLSCSECVERKTKCDRGRPHCLSCIKRQTECKYAHVANLLEETSRTAAASGGRRVTRPLLSKKATGSSLSVPNMADRVYVNAHVASLGSVALSTGLLSNVPYSMPSASNVFGIGSEHPFANYWTCEGGLQEVISVLPDKMQCDVLLGRYFECFDPVYPMLDQRQFVSDFETFWALPPEQKNLVDPAYVALLFAMLALGTQFVSPTMAGERKQTAEFYASASNQALRLSCYLSSASIRSIQSMVLITYFLVNDNHASDGWAFAGILMRQAYAMGLHRDPNIVVPNASRYEKHQRRKVWQAVLLQDTFLTVLLSLPPTATHTDVNVEDLEEEDALDPSNQDSITDTAYVRGSWTLANLVQEVISSPRSLDVPICTTSRHKSKMVSDFRAIYRSFPDVFRSWDPESLTQLAKTNKRVVRQTLFLSSNYFHNLMLVHASESADVPVNVRGTLEAAHDAITSFFVLYKLFESESSVWWVFNHRAFLEALCIGGVLKEAANKNKGDTDALTKDPMYARARADIEKMIDIVRTMGESGHGAEVAQTRVKVLREFL